MACIVKVKRKGSDTVYAYESISYWDPVGKVPRSHRRLIGKVDPVTQEIVPTGRPGRPRKDPLPPELEESGIREAITEEDKAAQLAAVRKCQKLEDTVATLRQENRRLRAQLKRVTHYVESLQVKAQRELERCLEACRADVSPGSAQEDESV